MPRVRSIVVFGAPISAWSAGTVSARRKNETAALVAVEPPRHGRPDDGSRYDDRIMLKIVHKRQLQPHPRQTRAARNRELQTASTRP